MFDHVEAFYRPSTVRDAVRLILQGPGKGLFVAGGTDVVVQADRSTRYLVDLTRLGLSYIQHSGDGWSIGATTTLAAIEGSLELRAVANGILSRAAASCGSYQNRNMATLGGNLANASPAADTATPLLALDAAVVVAGARSKRKVPLTRLFAAPHKTTLDGALIVEVLFASPPRGAGWSFQKLGRTATDISLVNAAAGVQLDARRRVKMVRIAMGGVAPTPMRAAKAEALLLGRVLDAAAVAECAAAVAAEVAPITDVRATAEYRREMSRVLAGRALAECAERAGCAL